MISCWFVKQAPAARPTPTPSDTIPQDTAQQGKERLGKSASLNQSIDVWGGGLVGREGRHRSSPSREGPPLENLVRVGRVRGWQAEANFKPAQFWGGFHANTLELNC